MSNHSTEPSSNNNQSPGGIGSISMVPLTVAIVPDEHQIVQVQVANESSIVEHYQVMVEGLSADWITLSQGDVRLMPNQNASFNFTIGPLPASARAGAYPFRLILQSTADPRLEGYAFGILRVRPAAGFTIDLSPSRIRNSGQARLQLTNTGNIEQRFSISGSDPEDRVIVHSAESSVRVEAGEEAEVALDVEPVARPFTGKTHILPFAVEVQPDRGVPDSVDGKLEVTPLIPRWLLTVLLLFMATTFSIGACSIIRLRQAARDELAGFATATVVAEDSFNAAATAYYGEWDSDNDGLSYAEEVRLGTDPTNSDHDGDTLNDGEEVRRGTNPITVDFDGDGLWDGWEVNGNPDVIGPARGQFTNPLDYDSNDNGLSDLIDPDSSDYSPPVLDPNEELDDPTFEKSMLCWVNAADGVKKCELQVPVGWKFMVLDSVPAPENPNNHAYAFPEMRPTTRNDMSECVDGGIDPICDIFVDDKALKVFKGGYPIRFALYSDITLTPGAYKFRVRYFADAVAGKQGDSKIWASEGAAQLQLCIKGAEYDHLDWEKVPIGRVAETEVNFVVPTDRTVTIYVNIKNPLSLSNNGWFFDGWSLQKTHDYDDRLAGREPDHGCEADMSAKLTN